jgi:hypothetical protein
VVLCPNRALVYQTSQVNLIQLLALPRKVNCSLRIHASRFATKSRSAAAQPGSHCQDLQKVRGRFQCMQIATPLGGFHTKSRNPPHPDSCAGASGRASGNGLVLIGPAAIIQVDAPVTSLQVAWAAYAIISHMLEFLLSLSHEDGVIRFAGAWIHGRGRVSHGIGRNQGPSLVPRNSSEVT